MLSIKHMAIFKRTHSYVIIQTDGFPAYSIKQSISKINWLRYFRNHLSLTLLITF